MIPDLDLAPGHADLGRLLDAMRAEATRAQHEAEAAAVCLGSYRSALHAQRVHLNRLRAQIEAVRDLIAQLDGGD